MERSSETPATEIDHFLRSGGSVCTFATVAARHGEIAYCVADVENNPQRQLLPAIDAFLKGARRNVAGRATACVIIDAKDPSNEEEHRRRSFELREEIGIAILRTQQWLPVSMGLRQKAKRLLADLPGILTIPAGKQQPVVFAMAPHYPPNHRRYAPRLILPVTLREDAIRFGLEAPGMLAAIHTQLLERCGELLGAMSFYEESGDSSAT